MVTLSVSETFKKTDDLATLDEVVEYLRTKCNNISLKTVLKHAFDPSIRFLLPEGEPPYTPSPYFESQTALYPQIRLFYLFIEGGHPTLKQDKREKLFIDLLESVDKEDARMLVAMKDKTLPYKNLTAEAAYLAFPEIFTAIPFKSEDEEVDEEASDQTENEENVNTNDDENQVDKTEEPVVIVKEKLKAGRPKGSVYKR